jgi:hypothetical protein
MRWLLSLIILLWTGVAKAQNIDLNAAGMRYVFEQWAQDVGAQEISLSRCILAQRRVRPFTPTAPFIWLAEARRSLPSAQHS